MVDGRSGIFVLIAGRGGEAGSPSWADATPDLLDIAGMFALAAEMLQSRSARDWLDIDQIVPAK